MPVYRIRPPVAVEEVSREEFQRRRLAYDAFLLSRKSNMPTDLWRFFVWDVFHDGTLEGVSWSRSMDVLRLRLNCPNIKHLDDTGGYQYVDMSFRCVCRGVTHVDLERTGRRIGAFMGSEIDAEDALLERAGHAGKKPPHSLLLEFESATMRLVFRDMSVQAVDRAEYERMQRDPSYFIPLTPDEDWMG